MDQSKWFIWWSLFCQQKYKVQNFNFINNIRLSDLWSDFCDYGDVYIVAEGTATVIGTTDAKRKNKKLVFKNNTPLYHEYQKPIRN